jgi:NADH:ubiquinone oxidoreductase subunit 6 (subunit J)
LIEAYLIAVVVLTVIFAILTIEMRDLIYSLFFFALMAISIAAFYWLLNAPYVAVFQLLIYAGAVVGLLVSAIMLTARREK